MAFNPDEFLEDEFNPDTFIGGEPTAPSVSPLEFAQQKVRETSPLTGLAMDARTGVRNLFQRGAEAIADLPAQPVKVDRSPKAALLRAIGGPLAPPLLAPAEHTDPEGFTVPAEIAGPVAGAVGVAPDIAEALIGGRGLGVAQKGSAVGKTRFSSDLLKQELKAGERAAGIKDTIPDPRALAKELDIPIKGLSDSRVVNALVNKVNEGVKFSTQQARDLAVVIGDHIKKNAPQGVAKFFTKKTTEGALQAKGAAEATKQLRKATGTEDVAGRLRQLNALKNVLRGGGAAGTVIGAGTFAFNKLQSLLGN